MKKHSKTHQKPSVLCTPPCKNSLIRTHRFCVLPPLKNHPSKVIGFMYSPLWKITHQNPSVLCTPPFEKSLFLVGAYFGMGVYFGKYRIQHRTSSHAYAENNRARAKRRKTSNGKVDVLILKQNYSKKQVKERSRRAPLLQCGQPAGVPPKCEFVGATAQLSTSQVSAYPPPPPSTWESYTYYCQK